MIKIILLTVLLFPLISCALVTSDIVYYVLAIKGIQMWGVIALQATGVYLILQFTGVFLKKSKVSVGYVFNLIMALIITVSFGEALGYFCNWNPKVYFELPPVLPIMAGVFSWYVRKG